MTIETVPLLLHLAFGATGLPVFVSETRNLYQYRLTLIPMEDADLFDLIQERGSEWRLYESCRVKGFELRFERDDAIKLKLDICGEYPPIAYPYTDTSMSGTVKGRERFNGDSVTYNINGQEYKNIYGLTLVSKKEGGTRTEIWIKRALEQGPDIPSIIDELTVTAQLLREKYEFRHFGTFRITIKRMILTSDETDINSTGPVIGPLRYYVADTVAAEVFTSDGEDIE